MKHPIVDDKLDIITETKVLRDLHEKEAKLRSDLVADGLEKKLMIEELIMKIECLEIEKKEAIESSNKAQNKYFLQTAGNDELLAMLAEELEKRIEAEKKVDDLKKLLDSMKKKWSRQNKIQNLDVSKSSKFCSKTNSKEERMLRERMAKWQ